MGPRIRDFGSYSIHGPNPRISLPKNSLDALDLAVGDEVRIEVIEPEEGPAHYEIHPKEA